MAVIALTIATPALPADAAWSRAFPRDFYEQLGRCETGGRRGNPAHSTRSYVGAFGHYRRTWDLFADTPNRRAHRLTWEQQARVLDRTFWYGHTENGRKQWAVGPWGHGCFKKLRHLHVLVCNHGKRAVRKWCRTGKPNG